jgi:hypothetical protein
MKLQTLLKLGVYARHCLVVCFFEPEVDNSHRQRGQALSGGMLLEHPIEIFSLILWTHDGDG